MSGENSREGERKCSWVTRREARPHVETKIGFLVAQATVCGWDRRIPGGEKHKACGEQLWMRNKQKPVGARKRRGEARVGLEERSRQKKSKKDRNAANWAKNNVLRYFFAAKVP